MTAAPSLPWPGSRVLAGWWPLLERWRPRALWLHHLLLHHLDASVTVSRSAPLEHFNRLLLEALAASPGLDELSRQLALDAALLSRLLADLEAGGLVQVEEHRWTLAEAGRQALEGRRDACTQQERRSFYFSASEAGHAGARFLPLDHPPTTPWTEGANWQFDLETLRACLAQSTEWKQARGFPQDVRDLVASGPDWQRIVLDRPEQLALVCLLVEDEDRLLGFAMQTSNWQLQAERPVLSLPAGWSEALPELTGEVSLEEWRQAWRLWGQPRGLPPGELEACHLEPAGARLRVRAPRPLLERLRAARSDAVKGEAWLLAGTGERTRTASLIELREGD